MGDVCGDNRFEIIAKVKEHLLKATNIEMQPEELKKEAIQYAIDYPTSYGNGYKHKDLRIAYLAGAEPREKRIAELEKENAELKTRVENQKSFLKRIRAKFNLGEIDRKEIEGYLEGDQLTYAKTIIQDLLDNSDEYARQRAEDFLKENK